MVPLGWALQSAGHEVRVAVAPPAADAIARSGLAAVPVLDTLDLNVITRMMYYHEATEGLRTLPGLPLHPFTGDPVSDLSEFDFAAEGMKYFESCEAAVARSYDGCVEFARAWQPDLVVYDLMSAEGALAAKLIDVPSVYFPPGLFGTVETEPAWTWATATRRARGRGTAWSPGTAGRSSTSSTRRRRMRCRRSATRCGSRSATCPTTARSWSRTGSEDP